MPRPVLRISTGVGAAVIVAATVTAQVGGAGPAVHVAAAATTPSPTPSSTPTAHKTPDPALTAAIKDRMSLATARTWAAVVDVEGVGRVVDVNGSAGLLPASTEKLFTTLPLLQQRPNDRLTTTIGAASAPARGVLQGDLVVRASGDPTLMGAGLVDLAKQVRAHGVTRVTGRLVLNIGHLSGARTRSGWKSSYVPGDVGPLSPFPVHYDAWRSAASYVAHPTVANLALLRSKLVAAGVHIAGGDVIARTGNTATTLATHSSATLRTIISHTLRWSDNFMAEQMLSIEGMSAVAATAGAAGASGSATDGSGLSLSDRRTAHGEVALLKAAHNGPAAAALLASLPVACSTGTLEHEMCHTSAAGKVFAKTGTLAHAKALAGYTTDAQGRLVSFAFLTGGDVSTSKAMNAIERSVILLRHYAG